LMHDANPYKYPKIF